MRKTIRSGFTLVELLVVITIIVILMSILLPALKKVKVIVGQGMCAKQLQTINQGFHGYSLEFNDKLPFVSGTANLPNSYAIDGFVGKPNGFGCVYEAKFFENHNLLYCPAGVSGTGWENGARDGHMENFPDIFEQRQWLAVDYSISYTSNEANTGYSAFPEVIVCPKDTVENLQKVYVLWTADARREQGPLLSDQYETHKLYSLMNFGLIDGSTRSVLDVYEHQPTNSKMKRKGVRYGESCMDSYWFSNDRPKWQFWRWFGPGAGF